jgi:hypothetical protein
MKMHTLHAIMRLTRWSANSTPNYINHVGKIKLLNISSNMFKSHPLNVRVKTSIIANPNKNDFRYIFVLKRVLNVNNIENFIFNL